MSHSHSNTQNFSLKSNIIQYFRLICQWCDRHRIDLVLFAGLGLCVLKFVSFLDLAVDIKLHDETYYLENGVNLFTSGLPDAQWGPLYAIWYYILSLLTGDRITLYDFNQQVLTGLTTLGLYVFLRKIKVTQLIAYFSSFFYLFSSLHDVDPRPTNFALLVLLIVLTIANNYVDNTLYFGILTIAFSWIIYIRPEYILSSLFFLLIFLYLNFVEWRNNKNNILSLLLKIILVFASIIFAIAIFGNPIAGGRSWFAFGQHFALNWVEWNSSDLNPWTNWGEILKEDFGKAENIRQAIQTNPMQFFRHLCANCDRYLNTSISLLLVSLKKYGFSSLLVEKLIFLQISLITVVVSDIIRKWRIIVKRCDRQIFQRLLITLSGILISVLPSIVLIYPREHYLILQGFLFIAIATYLFSYLFRDRITISFACILIILSLFITPNIAKGWCIAPNLCFLPTVGGEKIVLENRKTIEFIQALEIRDRINFLEAEGGYFVYLGHSYTRIFEWWKEVPFDRFLDEREINMVLVSSNLTTHPKYRSDPIFKEFLKHPQQYQFMRFKIPHTSFQLLVKRGSLQKN